MIVESFSGIRGVWGEDIDVEIARKYAAAYTQFLKLTKQKPTVVIGMDTRQSSPEIKKAMTEEFIIHGCDVIDSGVNTTPAIELAVREYKADGGVIITGSHNEPEHNGWKFLSTNGSILEPEDADLVISNYRKGKKITATKIKGNIVDKTENIRKAYVKFVLSSIGKEGIEKIKSKKLKIIVDPNGGAAATVIKEVLQQLGADIIEKNMKPGEFKRPIEPNSKTLAYMSSAVKKEKADLAAGFDCDGDRVEMIDDCGEMLSGQYVLALITEEILSQNKQKNSIVIVNDATSGIVKEIAEKYDAKTEEVEVGEINVVKKWKKKNLLSEEKEATAES
jgi:phosphomannomutase